MVKLSYLSPIDPHIHLRWMEYADMEPSFMELIFKEARAVGLRALIEQPNTSPALIDGKVIGKRMRLVDDFREKNGYQDIDHFIHAAITPDAGQRAEAYKLIQNHSRIVSGKVFHVRSTASGDIEIIDSKTRRESWEDSPDIPRTNHFEDGNMFEVEYDPERPETHSLKQCPEAETAMFEENFRMAFDAGFRGYFISHHTSNPDTIKLGDKLIKQLDPDFQPIYEGTPHHLLLNSDEDYRLHGNGVKMNPPLRPKEMQEAMFEYALAGRLMYGSDDASHDPALKGLPGWPLPEKGDPRSGAKSLYALPLLIAKLREGGMERGREEEMFTHRANRVYSLKLKPREVVDVEYDSGLSEPYKINIYSRVDGTN